MEIRKGVYTFYDGIEMLIVGYYGHGITNPEIENYRKISYNKEFGSLEGFKLDDKANIFFRNINVNELNNAFKVETKGRYKDETFSLWGYNKNRNVVGVITNDDKIAQKLDFIELSDFYIKEVSPEELDVIWEERTDSEFNLPMPEGIEKKKIIYQNDIS